MPDAALEQRYRETDYIVDDDPPLRLTVGEQNDGARILMVSFNVENAVFITAWNPGSQELSMDENIDRQADLLEDIEKLRLNYFVGRGEHPTSGWTEDSYFVLGMSEEDAMRLAKQYEQNAVLWIPMSGVPELRWTD